MAALQFVIDSICSKVTVESMYRLIGRRLSQGAFRVPEIVPLIQSEDRSLDYDSAKALADAAVEALAERGELKIDGDRVYPAT